jgi:replicative DNA helicase
MNAPGPQGLPSDTVAEQAVLGCMMLRASAIDKALEFLTSADFYLEGHGIVFDMMTTLHGAGVDVDPITLRAEAKKRGILDLIGGMNYFTDLLGSQFTTATLPHYAKLVSDKAHYRRMIGDLADIVDQAIIEARPAEELHQLAEERLTAIRPPSTENTIAEFRDLAVAEIAAIRGRLDYQDVPIDTALAGIPTGFKWLDWYISGMKPGHVIVLAARPGMGKTALAGSIICNQIKAARTVVLFTMEMPKRDMTNRLLSTEARVDSRALDNNTVQAYELAQIEYAEERLNRGRCIIDDNYEMSPAYIRSKLAGIQAKQAIDLVVIDHMLLMDSVPGGRPASQSMTEEATIVSRSMKKMAKQFGVPFLVLTQLNREGEKAGRRPILSDLKASGGTEQDADIVLMIHREKYQDASGSIHDKFGMQQSEVIVRKQRNGPTGTVYLGFTPAFCRFDNLADHEDPNGGPEPGGIF